MLSRVRITKPRCPSCGTSTVLVKPSRSVQKERTGSMASAMSTGDSFLSFITVRCMFGPSLYTAARSKEQGEREGRKETNEHSRHHEVVDHVVFGARRRGAQEGVVHAERRRSRPAQIAGQIVRRGGVGHHARRGVGRRALGSSAVRIVVDESLGQGREA